VPTGSLTVVGTGIAFGVHLTPQARRAIERADEVFYLLAEHTAEAWFKGLKAGSHSLRHHYAVGRARRETYERMVEEILDPVRNEKDVCAAFYGHPGVFASPSHEAVRRARAEGFPATMLPAISAEDCLFADLGVDPGESGGQSYEATDFLLRRRTFDTAVPLILWQVAFIGITTAPVAPSAHGFGVLVDYLLTFYPEAHPAIVYEASPYPVGPAQIGEFSLGNVRSAELGGMSTLYLPPAAETPEDAEMRALLEGRGIESSSESL
jgi:Tetrapyrrole (Corrin/Porphyrin) Methylases